MNYIEKRGRETDTIERALSQLSTYKHIYIYTHSYTVPPDSEKAASCLYSRLSPPPGTQTFLPIGLVTSSLQGLNHRHVSPLHS